MPHLRVEHARVLAKHVWAVSPRSCFLCTAFLCQFTWSRGAGLAISSNLAWPLLFGVLSSKFHFTRPNINVKRNVEGVSGPSAYTQPINARLGFTASQLYLRCDFGLALVPRASEDLALFHSKGHPYLTTPGGVSVVGTASLKMRQIRRKTPISPI
ncbi:hypothetical protein EDB83DRAFT_1769110 [Lactarius deliciosus]|nr:hypothetical protein EDB83DRAFT_1769110 [Lactarius deliciosus]